MTSDKPFVALLTISDYTPQCIFLQNKQNMKTKQDTNEKVYLYGVEEIGMGITFCVVLIFDPY